MTGYRLTPYNQIDDYGQEKMWKMSKQAPRKRKSQIASAVEVWKDLYGCHLCIQCFMIFSFYLFIYFLLFGNIKFQTIFSVCGSIPQQHKLKEILCVHTFKISENK